MIYSIHFIGGIRDGDTIAWKELPPEIHVQAVIDWSWMRDKSESDIPDAPLKIVRYRRVADTCNYLCLDWNQA